MKPSNTDRIKILFDRIARASASQEWNDGLNPAQRAVLTYLSNANEFSRAPSHIAGYMCATRGTISQSLKALERKGMVSQSSSQTDKRSISYEITVVGQEAIKIAGDFDAVLKNISPAETSSLLGSLELIAQRLLAAGDNRSFGICKDCNYHLKKRSGRFCSLLQIDLTPQQAIQLCHEQVPFN